MAAREELEYDEEACASDIINDAFDRARETSKLKQRRKEVRKKNCNIHYV